MPVLRSFPELDNIFRQSFRDSSRGVSKVLRFSGSSLVKNEHLTRGIWMGFRFKRFAKKRS